MADADFGKCTVVLLYLAVCFVILPKPCTDAEVLCYACDDVFHPAICAVMTRCSDLEACYTVKGITSTRHESYSSGCTAISDCPNALRARPNGYSTELCSECCREDLCNANLCNAEQLIPPEILSCAACNNQPSMDTCLDVAYCDVGELCYAERSPQNNLFSLGCSKTTECVGNRICCETNVCNANTNALVAPTTSLNPEITTTAVSLTNEGPVCFACNKALHPAFCLEIKRCTIDEVCYTVKGLTNTGSEAYYTSGCLPVIECPRMARSRPSPFQTELCAECCHGDLCNSNLCQAEQIIPPNGILCAACTNQQNVDDCVSVELCQPGEVCYAERSLQTNLFSFGCNNKIACVDERTCCETSVCNINAPVATSTSSVNPGMTSAAASTSSVSLNEGPVCFACNKALHPAFCLEIKRCGPNEACYTVKGLTNTGSGAYYTSDCLPIDECPQMARSRPSPFQTELCAECCHDDLCNSVLCQAEHIIPPNGLLCGACTNQQSVEDCNTVELCQPGNVCFAERNTQTNLFSLGCNSKTACVGERMCCETEVCNINGPVASSTDSLNPGMTSSVASVMSVSPDLGLRNEGPVCYACNNTLHPMFCMEIKQCAANEVCYTVKGLTDSGNDYTSDCLPVDECPPMARSSPSSFETELCVECCHDDLCNSNLCQAEQITPPNGLICAVCAAHQNLDTSVKVELCQPGLVCLRSPSTNGNGFALACGSKSDCVGDTECCETNVCNLRSQNASVPTTTAGLTQSPTGSSIVDQGRDLTTLSLPEVTTVTEKSLIVNSETSTRALITSEADASLPGTPTSSTVRSVQPSSSSTPSSILISTEVHSLLPNTTTAADLFCFTCTNVAHPGLCSEMKRCGPNEVCYTVSGETNTHAVEYSSGCLLETHCQNSIATLPRHFQRDICTECCTENLCNFHLCKADDTGIIPPDILMCANCTREHNTKDCSGVAFCEPDEVCYTKETGNGRAFNMGCIKKTRCVDGVECCDYSNLCNLDIIPATVTKTSSSTAWMVTSVEDINSTTNPFTSDRQSVEVSSNTPGSTTSEGHSVEVSSSPIASITSDGQSVDASNSSPGSITSDGQSVDASSSSPGSITSEGEFVEVSSSSPGSITSEGEFVEVSSSSPGSITSDGQSVDASSSSPGSITSEGESVEVSSSSPASITTEEESVQVSSSPPGSITSDGQSVEVSRSTPWSFTSEGHSFDASSSYPGSITSDRQSVEVSSSSPASITSEGESVQVSSSTLRSFTSEGQSFDASSSSPGSITSDGQFVEVSSSTPGFFTSEGQSVDMSRSTAGSFTSEWQSVDVSNSPPGSFTSDGQPTNIFSSTQESITVDGQITRISSIIQDMISTEGHVSSISISGEGSVTIDRQSTEVSSYSTKEYMGTADFQSSFVSNGPYVDRETGKVTLASASPPDETASTNLPESTPQTSSSLVYSGSISVLSSTNTQTILDSTASTMTSDNHVSESVNSTQVFVTSDAQIQTSTTPDMNSFESSSSVSGSIYSSEQPVDKLSSSAGSLTSDGQTGDTSNNSPVSVTSDVQFVDISSNPPELITSERQSDGMSSNAPVSVTAEGHSFEISSSSPGAVTSEGQVVESSSSQPTSVTSSGSVTEISSYISNSKTSEEYFSGNSIFGSEQFITTTQETVTSNEQHYDISSNTKELVTLDEQSAETSTSMPMLETSYEQSFYTSGRMTSEHAGSAEYTHMTASNGPYADHVTGAEQSLSSRADDGTSPHSSEVSQANSESSSFSSGSTTQAVGISESSLNSMTSNGQFSEFSSSAEGFVTSERQSLWSLSSRSEITSGDSWFSNSMPESITSNGQTSEISNSIYDSMTTNDHGQSLDVSNSTPVSVMSDGQSSAVSSMIPGSVSSDGQSIDLYNSTPGSSTPDGQITESSMTPGSLTSDGQSTDISRSIVATVTASGQSLDVSISTPASETLDGHFSDDSSSTKRTFASDGQHIESSISTPGSHTSDGQSIDMSTGQSLEISTGQSLEISTGQSLEISTTTPDKFSEELTGETSVRFTIENTGGVDHTSVYVSNGPYAEHNTDTHHVDHTSAYVSNGPYAEHNTDTHHVASTSTGSSGSMTSDSQTAEISSSSPGMTMSDGQSVEMSSSTPVSGVSDGLSVEISSIYPGLITTISQSVDISSSSPGSITSDSQSVGISSGFPGSITSDSQSVGISSSSPGSITSDSPSVDISSISSGSITSDSQSVDISSISSGSITSDSQSVKMYSSTIESIISESQSVEITGSFPGPSTPEEQASELLTIGPYFITSDRLSAGTFSNIPGSHTSSEQSSEHLSNMLQSTIPSGHSNEIPSSTIPGGSTSWSVSSDDQSSELWNSRPQSLSSSASFNEISSGIPQSVPTDGQSFGFFSSTPALVTVDGHSVETPLNPSRYTDSISYNSNSDTFSTDNISYETTTNNSVVSSESHSAETFAGQSTEPDKITGDSASLGPYQNSVADLSKATTDSMMGNHTYNFSQKASLSTDVSENENHPSTTRSIGQESPVSTILTNTSGTFSDADAHQSIDSLSTVSGMPFSFTGGLTQQSEHTKEMNSGGTFVKTTDTTLMDILSSQFAQDATGSIRPTSAALDLISNVSGSQEPLSMPLGSETSFSDILSSSSHYDTQAQELTSESLTSKLFTGTTSYKPEVSSVILQDPSSQSVIGVSPYNSEITNGTSENPVSQSASDAYFSSTGILSNTSQGDTLSFMPSADSLPSVLITLTSIIMPQTTRDESESHIMTSQDSIMSTRMNDSVSISQNDSYQTSEKENTQSSSPNINQSFTTIETATLGITSENISEAEASSDGLNITLSTILMSRQPTETSDVVTYTSATLKSTAVDSTVDEFITNTTISELAPDDNVTHIISDETSVGFESLSTNFDMTTTFEATTGTGPPCFENEIEVLKVPAHTNFDLPCNAYCSPYSDVTWSLPENVVGVTDHNILSLKTLDTRDSGVYTCTARNEFGETNHTVLLTVYEPVTASIQTPVTADVSTQTGSYFANCLVSGQPLPNITFSRVNASISPSAMIMISTFLMMEVGPGDAGLYACQAVTEFDSDTAYFALYNNVASQLTCDSTFQEYSSSIGSVQKGTCSSGCTDGVATTTSDTRVFSATSTICQSASTSGVLSQGQGGDVMWLVRGDTVVILSVENGELIYRP